MKLSHISASGLRISRLDFIVRPGQDEVGTGNIVRAFFATYNLYQIIPTETAFVSLAYCGA